MTHDTTPVVGDEWEHQRGGYIVYKEIMSTENGRVTFLFYNNTATFRYVTSEPVDQFRAWAANAERVG